MTIRKPNAAKYANTTPEYAARLFDRITLTQAEIHQRTGLTPRTQRYYKAGGRMPYPVQYTLEALAGGGEGIHSSGHHGAD